MKKRINLNMRLLNKIDRILTKKENDSIDKNRQTKILVIKLIVSTTYQIGILYARRVLRTSSGYRYALLLAYILRVSCLYPSRRIRIICSSQQYRLSIHHQCIGITFLAEHSISYTVFPV